MSDHLLCEEEAGDSDVEGDRCGRRAVSHGESRVRVVEDNLGLGFKFNWGESTWASLHQEYDFCIASVVGNYETSKNAIVLLSLRYVTDTPELPA